MSKAVLTLLTVLAVALPGATNADDKKDAKKGKRPELTLRATPRFSFSPANILFTAELKGGDDVEELYCPEVEWEFGDGGKSISEADCDPWEPGITAIERRFTKRHEFQRAGRYRVRVTLTKGGKQIRQTLQIQVRAGLGDPTMDY